MIVDRAGSDWKGRVGVVTELIAEAVRDPGSTFAFICGPEAMMRFSVRPLARAGHPRRAHLRVDGTEHEMRGRFLRPLPARPRCSCARTGRCFRFERVRPWFYMREI